MLSKLDVFYAADRLSQAEYLELSAMLGKQMGDEQANA